MMLARSRLEALLEQAIDAQLARCMFHNNHHVAVSLLSDYVAGAEQIPTRTVQARLRPSAARTFRIVRLNGAARWPAQVSVLAKFWGPGAQVLLEHQDEVWHLQFSHDGAMLASASKDGTALVWDVSGPRRRVTKRHSLRGHVGPVLLVAWSPDDSKLATAGDPPSHPRRCFSWLCPAPRICFARPLPSLLQLCFVVSPARCGLRRH